MKRLLTAGVVVICVALFAASIYINFGNVADRENQSTDTCQAVLDLKSAVVHVFDAFEIAAESDPDIDTEELQRSNKFFTEVDEILSQVKCES